jgi:hypothetical protein
MVTQRMRIPTGLAVRFRAPAPAADGGVPNAIGGLLVT